MSVYRTVVVFLQPNDGFVTSHIGGQVDADATYGVLQDAVDEQCHKELEFQPFRAKELECLTNQREAARVSTNQSRPPGMQSVESCLHGSSSHLRAALQLLGAR